MLLQSPVQSEFDQIHFDQIAGGMHTDPHLFLGIHPLQESEKKIIRIYCPGACEHYCLIQGQPVKLDCMDERGLFVKEVTNLFTANDYQVYLPSGQIVQDPYTFEPSFSVLDQYFFSKGVHYDLYTKLGAQKRTVQGVEGISFCVWAPNAQRVSLIGDFNGWDGRRHPMRVLGSSGVYEIFIPELKEGQKYKFQIRTKSGAILEKADPYAFYSELRPKTASVTADPFSYKWNDAHWMSHRPNFSSNSKGAFPMSIYEVHLGSWQRHPDGTYHTYKELKESLIPYVKEMGFTHVEFMPISEHPFDQSWGYQTTSYFAPTSRFGSLKEFQELIDAFHQASIGVILDWVPGHFPADDFGLKWFDGSALYEHIDPKEGWHPHWQTCIFNFSRFEVTNFLLSSALFWLKVMHIDGLRVDAVASMIYRDYGRSEGSWIPNAYGGRENLEAIEFLKHLNSIVQREIPSAFMIAEESTSYEGVTKPVEHGGLGFDLKWNMGWMNDTLRYFSKDMIYRKYHHNDLTFGLLYAFSERFMLSLSHDEVVHGKKSLLDKMPGDWWQKFANLRLLYSYMYCQPGKKLLFMGGEFGQWNEWDVNKELDWWLCQNPEHRDLKYCVQQLNQFYKNNCALWLEDFSYDGFEWISHNDSANSIIAYLRKSSSQTLLCTHNCTPQFFPDYYLSLGNIKSIIEVFNTDAAVYGGSGKKCSQSHIHENSEGKNIGVSVMIAPLSTQIFNIEFH